METWQALLGDPLDISIMSFLARVEYLIVPRTIEIAVVGCSEGGNVVTADEEKAEVLNAFFSSVFSGKTTCLQDNCCLVLVDGANEQNSSPIIQEEAVKELVRCLDTHKSMGPDGIHPRVMRDLADELVKPLSIIYQQSWLTGEVPDDWKLANVTPIHKKDGREDPSNYRPVSLTSVPGKIIEQFILSVSTQHLQDGQGLRPSQHRFRRAKVKFDQPGLLL
ncbi:hypothetical protein DUI87_18468 [Hirundo rustica rustica]|uniref:Reverse transcriptase domain-containing protein n=1 Tax=Hirundo rustica rustica TaxID=333673 RepID=A0A3M0JYP5_HIRRU|nr:hypothetical protein DUI87_18468 [Hirundo rustica rustica]